ncbi:energy transducer TonB [Acinetobacter sp. WZC-1]|uniref:energy transducer TonB n=1 Tax=Acinetobacter sp. WZC-1 TaxID=3459034 RepID=UPI00403E12E2
MSQSSTASLKTSPPAKKRIMIALLTVMIGHLVVLWVVSHMKVPELTPIEKKPLNVKFVKLKEDAPPPPPPVEPVKPKVEPKPEPKVVEPLPKPVEKPKVIAQKPEKKQEKAIQQDDTLEKQKLEQQRQEQQLKEQQQREQEQREQQQREQQRREQERLDQQRREQDNQNKARNVSKGDLSWKFKPRIDPEKLSKYISKGQQVSIVLLFEADAEGAVKSVRLQKSTGIPELDNYIVGQAQKSTFKAYRENGVKVPFKVIQDFILEGPKS